MYGINIKKTRKINKITQIELSKATGIPQNTISWIEKDKGKISLNDVVKIADYFEISIDELIGRDFIL